MLQIKDIQQLLFTKKKELREEYGIKNLKLYGSYALNRQHIDSDIDFLYEMETGKKMTLRKLQRMESLLSMILQIDKVELVNGKYINPIVYQNIKSYVISIF